MSEKEETKGEKTPILPKYYKADMDEEAVPAIRKKSTSISSSCFCRVFVVLVIIFIISAIIGLGVGLGVHYGVRSSSSSTSLANTIKSSDLKALLRDLQDTAVNNSRSVLTGYNNSAEFVIKTLEENGYTVTKQYFNIPVPEDNEGMFKVTTAINGETAEFEYAQYSQFAIMIYSAGCSSNCMWGLFSLIDDDESDFGCDTVDSNDVSGKAVLVPYTAGNCSAYEKAKSLKDADAAAVIFVSGSTDSTSPPRTRVFEREDDGSVSYVDIPSVGITNATGNQLLQFLTIDPQTSVTLELSASVTTGYTYNVFAETEEGKPDSVIMFGSHLDSVPAGPGINDDGSGSMTNLEVAIQIAKKRLEPKNKVRFAWWGAEELGLLGSRYYVAKLDDNMKDDISLYLNFDMVGSPNYIRGVYSAKSAFMDDIIEPLTKIQDLFIEYFNNTKLNYTLVDFSGGSDYRPFLDANIPAGGLFTGAGDIKTEAQWELFGGLRNVAHDPCYHQFCDTVNNVNYNVYEEMSRAAAYTLQTLMEQDDLEGYLNGKS